MRLLSVFVGLLLLVGCGDPVPRGGEARIMAMGDSLMAWHAASDRSIADVLADRLGEPVVDRSVVGASYTYPLPISGSLGLRISAQYVPGDWDWVVLNGGGNDLWLGCGCLRCDAQLERLVSPDGTQGKIPALVSQIRRSGARVAYIGYLRTPGVTSPV
ncbi:MAG: SGNH/GDSL hydrolase family protein, partial [Pseudomonadota bacterium]